MESLPPEILLLIGQNIPDRSSIRALTECCWQFRQIFQPLFYSSIEIKKFTPEYHIPLALHLFQRPDLARRVSFARITWCTTCDEEHGDHDDHDIDHVTDSAFEFVRTTLDNFYLDDEDPDEWRAQWEDHLSVGCRAAWISLIITQLTRLERLELRYSGDFDFMYQMLARAVKRQRPFHSRTPFPLLQEIKLSCLFDGYWIDAHDARPFFYLPAVSVIEADGVLEKVADPFFDDEKSVLDFSETDKPISQVRTIKISRAYNCIDMKEWIEACDKLEHFELEAEMLEEPSVSQFYQFSAPSFRDSLLLAKDTLKTIRFSFGKKLLHDRPGVFSPRDFDMNGLDNTPFGSFKEFHVLGNLSIRYRNLSSRTFANLLPSSLQTLEIIDIKSKSFSRIMWNLADLVESRESFPNLNKIVLKHLGFSGKVRNEVDVEGRNITGLDDPWVSGLGLGDLSIYLKNTCVDAGVSIKIYWSRVFDWGYLGF
ncbi:hypothetical protein N7493_003637 [Penicillium malachiteum]|uniref:Leucine-rich repeat domain-containing protein n=1 Tax=Penicillium malachiteum TaxID=1324776 RepID=A0AAD6MXU1_9EURO|nr:hypothetical protein N7493_003637 [Penicillium malachiteum]